MSTPSERNVLITGGAGFIGTNLALRLARDGRRVVVLDNLSRSGVEHNARLLARTAAGRVQVLRGDCRDAELVSRLVREAGEVFHFAAQVAVTTSLEQPALDFDVNVRGTLTVLEAIRACARPPRLLYTSTNKVYGALPWLELERSGVRYRPSDLETERRGISEDCQLDFHSPYGCSKGAADQYVRDYARSFGVPAVVFRMSCIYGLHQYGNEDQGWVAHLAKRVLAREQVSVFGDGLQVRDLLFVDDLIEALLLASAGAEELAGQAFNIGGGVEHAVSVLELLRMLGELSESEPDLRFFPQRVGDQRYYVSDVGRFARATGWRPATDVRSGVARLCKWLSEHALSHTNAAPLESVPGSSAGGLGLS